MPVTADDLMTDFEAAIERMYEEAKAEYDAMPTEEREPFYLRKSALGLARLLELKAPQIIIDMAEDRLAESLARRKAARAGRPSVS